MKKILMISHHHHPSPRVELEARALAENGYSVTFLVWQRAIDDYLIKKDVFDVKAVTLLSPRGKFRVLWRMPALYRKLYHAMAAEHPDIVHVTHLLLLPLAVYYGLWHPTLVVYDAYERHAIDFAEYLPVGNRFFQKVFEGCENWFVRRTAAVLTTDSPGDVLKKRYVRHTPLIEIVYNVPDLTVQPDPERVAELKWQYAGSTLLVYAGGLGKKKGLLQYLQLIKHLKETRQNIKLLLIGMYDSDEKTFVQTFIEQYGLGQELEVIPWLPYRELLAYLEVADIGLALYQPHPNFQYVSKGTGRKFFTYMAAGLPVLASNFGEISQVVEEANCGILVDSQDLNAIAAAARQFLENPGEAKAMGERGRRMVETRYNWQIEQQKVLKLYEHLNHA